MASVRLQGQFNSPTYMDPQINVYAYLMITGSDVLLIDTGVGEGTTLSIKDLNHIERQLM